MTEGDRVRWVQVSTELLAELGEWSEPVRVKVVSDTDGELDMVFQRFEPDVPRVTDAERAEAQRVREEVAPIHTDP